MEKEENTYTSHFCEENIHLLISNLITNRGKVIDDLFCIFISSEEQQTPIWRQSAGNPVVWDYHVILLERASESRSIIYDYDSVMPFPCPASGYVDQAFQLRQSLRSGFDQLFRVISAANYLNYFASDRSHMVSSGKPFPVWACLQGPLTNEQMNLMSFVSVKKTLSISCDQMLSAHFTSKTTATESQPFGHILTRQEFSKWIASIDSH